MRGSVAHAHNFPSSLHPPPSHPMSAPRRFASQTSYAALAVESGESDSDDDAPQTPPPAEPTPARCVLCARAHMVVI
jgi:hypothetical protein